MSLEIDNRALGFWKTSALLLISSDMHQSVFAVYKLTYQLINCVACSHISVSMEATLTTLSNNCMISYSGDPQNLNLNWCKNYGLQNTLIRCEKVDFPYISMELFSQQYKAVVFCSAKSRSYVSEAILIATKVAPHYVVN